MHTPHTRYPLLFLFEFLAVAALSAAILFSRSNAQAVRVSLSDWSSDYILYEDGWYADESSLPTDDTVDMIYGPYCSLARGSYTVRIDYSCSSDQSCRVLATQGNSAYLHTGESTLSRFGNSLSYRFDLTEDIDNLEVVVRYNGQGFLQIKNITITPDTAGLSRALCILILLFLLLDLCLIFRRAIEANRPVILALCGITLLVSLPLFMNGIAWGHDIHVHLMRIEGIADELRRGIFPVRLSSLWMNGYGYPISIYYGDLLLYLPAVLRLTGFSVVTSYKCYLLLINLGTTVISYLCFRQMFGKRKLALLLSLVYATAGYHVVCLYVRAAVGEFSAAMFLPLIGLAIWQIYTKETRIPENALLLSIGMTGIIGTHILSVEMAVFSLLLVCLMLWRKTFRRGPLLTYALAAAQTALLNLYFLIPFLDYYFHVDAVINDAIENTTAAIQTAGVYPAQLFSFFQTMFGLDSTRVSERLALTPGPVLMAALALALYLWLARKASRAIQYLTAFSCVILFVSSDLFPWNFLAANTGFGQLLSQVQFPWRYLSIAVLSMTMLLGALLSRTSSGVKNVLPRNACLSVMAVCVIMACYFVSDYCNGADMYFYYDTPELNLWATSGGEYLRTGTDKSSLNGMVSAKHVKELSLLSRDGCHMELYCEVSDEAASIDLPILHYRGYQVWDDQGNHYDITDGKNDVIRFSLPAGFSGKITVDFIEPWYWRLGELISVVTVPGICAVGVWRRRRS